MAKKCILITDAVIVSVEPKRILPAADDPNGEVKENCEIRFEGGDRCTVWNSDPDLLAKAFTLAKGDTISFKCFSEQGGSYQARNSGDVIEYTEYKGVFSIFDEKEGTREPVEMADFLQERAKRIAAAGGPSFREMHAKPKATAPVAGAAAFQAPPQPDQVVGAGGDDTKKF